VEDIGASNVQNDSRVYWHLNKLVYERAPGYVKTQ